ncbi:MAG: excinuclease ABC subunit UvrB [Fibrobacterales bacterium]
MREFQLESEYSPAGDQPKAIKDLVTNFNSGDTHQMLMGVTGSGKTYTMANVIQQLKKKTLIMTHNKTLAAQLYQEFKEFFPHNAVEYFVSYYDYYQPEAYVVRSDTFIEKDASINDEIDKLRMRTTTSLLTRDDVIVIASVSCIYGLGSPKEWEKMMLSLNVGMEVDRDDLLRHLVEIQYSRDDIELKRGTFRVRGDVVEIHPSYEDFAYRIEMFGDEIEAIHAIDILTGKKQDTLAKVLVAPAKHYVTGEGDIERIMRDAKAEMKARVSELRKADKLIEAQRLESRVNYDMEMLEETGSFSGIENYSRLIENRAEGTRPSTLIDFFGDDFLLILDESHVSIPQIGGMYGGDRSRKNNLVDYGFRLPSALDNRPMNFGEFEESNPSTILYVSATPGKYEMEQTGGAVVEQVIRPTGLLDPTIELHPSENQIDYLIENIQQVVEKGERVLVTTLTKKMAEDLTDFLKEAKIKVTYMHSDIKTLERTEIIAGLRNGTNDVLVGINLLREGLDIPEVSLVAILDADKEGFLRSYRSLIQTMGRAARNVNGRVILFADKNTDSMKVAINETRRRRTLQEKHNFKHGITPVTVKKKIASTIKIVDPLEDATKDIATTAQEDRDADLTPEEIEARMHEAAANLDFEEAARLRDLIIDLEKE